MLEKQANAMTISFYGFSFGLILFPIDYLVNFYFSYYVLEVILVAILIVTQPIRISKKLTPAYLMLFMMLFLATCSELSHGSHAPEIFISFFKVLLLILPLLLYLDYRNKSFIVSLIIGYACAYFSFFMLNVAAASVSGEIYRQLRYIIPQATLILFLWLFAKEMRFQKLKLFFLGVLFVTIVTGLFIESRNTIVGLVLALGLIFSSKFIGRRHHIYSCKIY